MAITLRLNKGSKLTFQEMDENFKSLFYDASITNDVLTLKKTGTGDVDIDLSPYNQSVDYVSNVTLSGTDLTFTGQGSAFSSTVDLSSLVVPNTDTYLIELDLGGNNILTATLSDGSTVTEDLSSLNQSVDYVSNVTLSNDTLNFTGVGSAFNGSIDLSTLDNSEGEYLIKDSLGVDSNPATNSYKVVAGYGQLTGVNNDFTTKPIPDLAGKSQSDLGNSVFVSACYISDVAATVPYNDSIVATTITANEELTFVGTSDAEFTYIIHII